ncbi:hypothetical protein EPO15_02395 [bacterium]|nr:MAG: hypothetical protein EPO15_02395 [bacterium]
MKLSLPLALTLALASTTQAAGLSSAAKTFARGAQDAGITRVAVLPFKAVGGSEDGRGRLLAEDLSRRLDGRRDVRLVERAGLEDVMAELAFGQTGAVDARRRPEPGRLAAAEAVVTGVYAALGGKAEVHARLVRVEDGLVLASARVLVDAPPLPGLSPIPEPGPLSAAESVAEALAFQGRVRDAARVRRNAPKGFDVPRRAPAAARSDLRDALGDECRAWQARSDALQAGILELKARYWGAQAAKRGFKAPAEAPGASFFDASLKARFAAALAEAAESPEPLSMTETKEFLDADREAFGLRARCGK